MKRKTFSLNFEIVNLLFALLITTNSFALNYTISFTGSGASTTVESVIVQNLTKGTTVTVPAGNVLNLTDIATSIDNSSSQVDGISLFPNPIINTAIVSFNAKQSGQAQISVFDLAGHKIVGQNEDLLQGNNSFKLTLPKGTFLIKVQGKGVSYTTKAICQSVSTAIPEISIISKEQVISNKPQKSKSAVTSMLYSSGDQLLYKGKSGNYCTIVTDKPTESKTTNFEFVECKDADNNYYAVVKIGSQTWMAENLKTTRFQNNELITNVTNNTWSSLTTAAWCNYNNDISYDEKHGKLYNWFAVDDNRNIAPIGGWHVPSNYEWSVLEGYLYANGFNFDDSNTLKIAKSIASTTDWASSDEIGSAGFNLNQNNSSGFSALPSGARSHLDGSFHSINTFGYWWTTNLYASTYPYYRILSNYILYPHQDHYNKKLGHSVRCVKY
jgi:uncharacterized protein (TIGR02145 family)